MSAVVEAVESVVEGAVDIVGDVAETVVDVAADVVETVVDTAANVIEGAIEDPVGTIIKVGTAIYAPQLLPAVNAALVVANGGDLEDAATAAVVSYVAPQVGSAVAGEIAGTAFGDMLNEAAVATGIESLPGAVANGIGRAATSTVVNVARGQDFEDALESGAISGVASVLGRVAGSEADTGYNIADRFIGTAVSAATNAGLRGLDVNDAVENAISNDIFNMSLGFADKQIKTALKDYKPDSEGITALQETFGVEFEPTTVAARPEDISESAIATETGVTAPTMLASLDTGVTSDATEGLPPGYFVDFDGTVKPIQRIEIEGVAPSGEDIAKQYSDEMFNELVNQFSQKEQEQVKVDALGNVYDKDGNFIGYASDFNISMTSDPTTGGIAWQTEQGQVIKPIEFGPEISTPSPSTSIITGEKPFDISEYGIVGDQEGDYPTQIINNPDGSVTSVEADGSSYTFNSDGSITYSSPEGETSIVGGAGETTTAEPAPESQSDFSLSNLVNSLIGPSQPSGGGGAMPFVASLGALGAIGAMGDDSASYDQYGISPYGFSWNPYAVNEPVEGVAYGQEFFNPTYETLTAATGGLMSIPQYQPTQYIQPTIPMAMNSNQVQLTQDPTSSVQMYRHGGHLGSYSDGGRMLKGPGDGMSDDIPATIAGRQPARLANEEFVIPADVVSHLGNGSSEAGAKVLYKMMADVRKARTGKTKQAKQINPDRFMPRR